MYLRIPPPTDKSLAAETFYNTKAIYKLNAKNTKPDKDDSENADVTSEDEGNQSLQSDDEMLYRRKYQNKVHANSHRNVPEV
jgi:hypothetical protein